MRLLRTTPRALRTGALSVVLAAASLALASACEDGVASGQGGDPPRPPMGDAATLDPGARQDAAVDASNGGSSDDGSVRDTGGIGDTGSIGDSGSVSLAPACPSSAGSPDAVVMVHVNHPLVVGYLGAGQHLAPLDHRPTDARWATIWKRLDFARPRFARVMVNAAFYFQGFDASGNPKYTWDSERMKETYRMLDYAQQHDMFVVFGEWGSPGGFGIAPADARWARLIGDCLEHLMIAKGYTAIRAYNLINEPNGSWSSTAGDFSQWSAAIGNLYSELKSRNLPHPVSISGPDETGDESWVTQTVTKLAPQIGVYDLHRYDTIANVSQGVLEGLLRTQRDIVSARDPNGTNRRFTMNETGLSDGKLDPHDSQSLIATHDYGIRTLDMIVQTARAGMDGNVPWDLDDAQHGGGGDGALDLKMWGFWNSQAGSNGYAPAEWSPRPWFYTWSLASRLSPGGSDTVHTSYAKGVPGLRATAMRRATAGGYDVTVVLVNDSDAPLKLSVVVPDALEANNWARYDYLASASPAYDTDADGLPRPAAICSADLARGTPVLLPPKSAKFLTTLDGGSLVRVASLPKNLAEGKPANSSSADDDTHPATFATDGKGFTRWSSSYNDNQWLQVDLQTPTQVSRVRVAWEAAYGKDYEVQVSLDGVSFRTVAANRAGGGGVEELVFAPVSARYVRLVGNSRSTQYGFSVFEFAVFP